MFTLPSSRRLVTPALVLFVAAASLRLCLQLRSLLVLGPSEHSLLKWGSKSSSSISFETFFSPSIPLHERFLTQYTTSTKNTTPNPHVKQLLSTCKHTPNPRTNHIRLSNIPILNISMVPSALDSNPDDFRSNRYFNPAIIPLPSYISASSSTPYHYLLISRLVTTGTHQESHICFANICSPSTTHTFKVRSCTDEDTTLLGDHGGMRCVTRPEKVNIPSTPARKCTGSWSVFPDIPGFHDPRVFWSGRGEPLIEVNSGSVYGCVGLWLQDLRSVYPPLDEVLKRKRKHDTQKDGDYKEIMAWKSAEVDALGALTGYPRLTELKRNPRSSRASVEKNWILFFPSWDEMWLQYNAMGKTSRNSISNFSAPVLSFEGPGRTISQVLSHGYTTTNLTSTFEPSCFNVSSSTHSKDLLNNTGHWHQGTNSLRLILCTRSAFYDRTCTITTTDTTSSSEVNVDSMSTLAYEEHVRASGGIVHFSIIHRKFTNSMDLPMRYERYIMVWEARKPFRVVAVSSHPVVFGRERVRPWGRTEDGSRATVVRRNGTDFDWGGSEAHEEEDNDAYFTYTPSISWAFRGDVGDRSQGKGGGVHDEDLGTGYLDDDVIVGIGMDDVRQGFVRVSVRELLECLRVCLL